MTARVKLLLYCNPVLPSAYAVLAVSSATGTCRQGWPSNSYTYTRTLQTLMDFQPSSAPSTSGSAINVTLEESDIEGAALEDTLDSKTVPQLRWWLLCHGIQAPSSEKKAALIKRYININLDTVRTTQCSSFFAVGYVLPRRKE